MDKRFLAIGFLLIALVTVGLAGGELIEGFTKVTKDVSITYPTTKTETSFSINDMVKYDDIRYEVKGNIIVLNKEGLFQNRTITMPDLNYCASYDKNDVCTNWALRDKDTVIQEAIKKEIEFVQGVQAERALRTTNIVEQDGKVIITSEK